MPSKPGETKAQIEARQKKARKRRGVHYPSELYRQRREDNNDVRSADDPRKMTRRGGRYGDRGITQYGNPDGKPREISRSRTWLAGGGPYQEAKRAQLREAMAFRGKSTVSQDTYGRKGPDGRPAYKSAEDIDKRHTKAREKRMKQRRRMKKDKFLSAQMGK